MRDCKQHQAALQYKGDGRGETSGVTQSTSAERLWGPKDSASHLGNCPADPVNVVPQLAAGGCQASEGLLEGQAGVVGPVLHDLTQPHHLGLLRGKLQLSCNRLRGVQNLFWRQQGQEELAIACSVSSS